MTDSESSGATAEHIIDNYSIEMTAKDMESLREARNAIPKKTAISVTFLPGEDMPARVAAATLVKSFGFTGYPEGHPDIPDEKLWDALRTKHLTLTELGHGVEIMTQFAFDSAPVLRWLDRVRQDAKIAATVRVGLPGPASVKTLLRFAGRCGVGATAG